jgi:hypothetical protein
MSTTDSKPKPLSTDVDDLRQKQAVAQEAYESSKNEYYRHEAHQNEVQELNNKLNDKVNEQKEKVSALEQEERDAWREVEKAQQHHAGVKKKIKDASLAQQQVRAAIQKNEEKGARACERKEQAAINNKKENDKLKVLGELIEACNEHKLAREQERWFHDQKKQKRKEMQDKAEKLLNLSTAKADHTAAAECHTSCAHSHQTRHTTAQQCPPPSGRSAPRQDHGQISEQTKRPPPAPQPNDDTRRRESKRRKHEENERISTQEAVGCNHHRSEPTIPQLRTPGRRQVTDWKFYAWMETAALFPDVKREELETWLNETTVHIIIVHLIGDRESRTGQIHDLRSVVKTSSRWAMCEAENAPVALIYRECYNRVKCESSKTADTMTSAVFEIQRIVQGTCVAPYAVGVVQALGKNVFELKPISPSDIKSAITSYHKNNVSFVSVYGNTAATGMRAQLLLCNPMWRTTDDDTAVADLNRNYGVYALRKKVHDRGKWQWAAIPHFLLCLTKVEGGVRVPCLNHCMHVDKAPDQADPVPLSTLPRTYITGPAVTFPTGIRAVDLSDDSDSDPREDRTLRYVKHVYQREAEIYKSLHIIQVKFGKFES